MIAGGASAPGKALLCGEYAVLEGAPAVVAAVDRRVSVRWTESSVQMPPEVEATLQSARALLGPTARALIVDVSELQRGGIKIGLGSSAAAAAATAAAAFAARGRNLAESTTLREVFACALEGHASIAPQGSGVDVAASTYGGFLRFSREGDAIEARPLSLPKGLQIRLVWTGHTARTSELLRQVHELRRDDPGRYSLCFERLSNLSGEFASAFEAGRPEAILATAASYASAMGALGEAAGAPILDARLQRATELATRFSGAAKPCGAGGGDVAIAFFLDVGAARGFELACEREGLHPIDVSWGAPGVRAC